jgi:hypothetical protein
MTIWNNIKDCRTMTIDEYLAKNKLDSVNFISPDNGDHRLTNDPFETWKDVEIVTKYFLAKNEVIIKEFKEWEIGYETEPPQYVAGPLIWVSGCPAEIHNSGRKLVERIEDSFNENQVTVVMPKNAFEYSKNEQKDVPFGYITRESQKDKRTVDRIDENKVLVTNTSKTLLITHIPDWTYVLI